MESIKILGAFYRAVHSRLELITRTSYWELKVALSLALFAFITSFPDLHNIRPEFMEALQYQFDHPFEPLTKEYLKVDRGIGAGVLSHLDKRWIRLLIPLIGHYTGVKASQWFMVECVLGIFFFYLSLKTVTRYTGDKVLALLFTAGLAGLFVGKWFFNDFYVFDPTAYFLLLCALYIRHLVGIAVLLFLAFFVDERALMVSPCILYAHFFLQRQQGSQGVRPLTWVGIYVVLVLLYFSVKGYLKYAYGFEDIMSDVGKGHTLAHNFRYLPMGYLLHFEAFWAMVVFVSLLLWSEGHKFMSLGLLGVLLLMNTACFLVFDVGRSTGYLFPFLFLYLFLLVQKTTASEAKKVVFVCSFLCLLIPTYVIWIDGIYWLSPILPKALKLL